MAEPDLLVIGRIGKPQGIKGEVTVEVRTDDPDARFAVGAVLLTDPPERGPLTVASSRFQNGRLMVGFEGVADRNAAELLRQTLRHDNGAEVLVPFVQAMVPEVDVVARILVIDPPEGLLELSDSAPEQ